MGFNPRISSGPVAIAAAHKGRTYDCTRPSCTNAHKNPCQTGASTYDKATFTVEAFPNRTFSGAVTQIRPSPQTYEHVATYDVVISAPNPDLLLEPGMAATIRIVIE
jgi:hypothetical protein